MAGRTNLGVVTLMTHVHVLVILGAELVSGCSLNKVPRSIPPVEGLVAVCMPPHVKACVAEILASCAVLDGHSVGTVQTLNQTVGPAAVRHDATTSAMHTQDPLVEQIGRAHV